ncbi:MAG: T9SS type A sorting domain-containing protein [Ignavibacteriota bacterium]
MRLHNHSKAQNNKFRFSVFTFLFTLLFVSNITAHQQEWLMQIIYAGAGPTSAHIILYQGGVQIDDGYSTSTWTFNPSEPTWKGNVGSDVNKWFNSGDSEFDDPPPTWSIKNPGNYIVRIIYANVSDRYFAISIPSVVNQQPDFNIKYNIYDGSVTYINNNRGVTPATIVSYPWTDYSVTLKNSFNADGIMSVDYSNVSIPVGGKTETWSSPLFPRRLAAIDQQPTGINYVQRFFEWTSNLIATNTNRSINVNGGTGFYQANFKNEYNIIFQNSFSGASGGVITVNNIQHSAPYQTTLLQYDSIPATAATNPINGISYSFSHWSNGSTQGYNYYFKPNDHSTYTAYYIGKANNTNRNLHYNSSDPNQPITVIWNEHPNTYVTKYQIWRRSKYKKQATSEPVLIGTVNRGTTTFVDFDYAGTNSGFTDWILWYDVKSYFSLDATYSDDDFVLVFSDGLLQKNKAQNSANIVENKIENYPNPFNPSTVITFQIINAGYVTLKVYDNLGREIETLVNEEKNSGKYNVVFDGANLSSGIYFYRIISNGFVETKKMILTK